jgi:hypothetical protein
MRMNRQERARLLAAIARLQVGEEFRMSLPVGQPGRREAARRVHGIAYEALGPGQYSGRCEGEWFVVRLKTKECGVSKSQHSPKP